MRVFGGTPSTATASTEIISLGHVLGLVDSDANCKVFIAFTLMSLNNFCTSFPWTLMTMTNIARGTTDHHHPFAISPQILFKNYMPNYGRRTYTGQFGVFSTSGAWGTQL